MKHIEVQSVPFPIVSPLSKPHPAAAPAQKPRAFVCSLCFPSFSFSVHPISPFLSRPPLLCALSFLLTSFLLFLSILQFPAVSLSFFYRLNRTHTHTHADPFCVGVTLLAAFVSACSLGPDIHLGIQHRQLGRNTL